jgi:acetyltransferase AlgX (SGNH hydrolase-like protein)
MNTTNANFSRSKPTKLIGAFPRYMRVGVAVACVVGLAILGRRALSPPVPGCTLCVGSAGVFATVLLAAYALLAIVYVSLSSLPPRESAVNCVLSAAAVAFVLAILETPALLGVLDYRIVLAPRDSVLYITVKAWTNPRNQIDKELLYLHRPNQRFVGSTRGDLATWLDISPAQRYPVDIQYDSRGFRNAVDLTQAAVVILGDSFVESDLVPYDELLSTRLGRQLGIPIANLGQVGYGPQQELIVLRRFGIDLQPKVVLWLFFEGNDLLDFDRYARSIGTWSEESAKIHSFANRSLSKNLVLALAGYLTPVPQATNERRSCRRRHTSDVGSDTLYFGFGEAAPSAFGAAPLSAADLEALSKSQAVFVAAQQLAAQHGAQLVFVYVPTKYRVYRDLCEFPEDSFAKGWELNDLPARLQSWCATQGIPFVDLTPALQSAAARDELVFYADDGHWNSAGNAVANETLSAFLRSHGLL